MAISSDLVGNKFNNIACRFGKFSLLYPNASFFESEDLSNFSSTIDEIFESLGYKHYAVVSQSNIDSGSFYSDQNNRTTLFKFAFDGDSLSNAQSGRIAVSTKKVIYSNSTTFYISQYRDDGVLDFETSFDSNIFYKASESSVSNTKVQMVISANEDTFAIFLITTNLITLQTTTVFIGVSKLRSVNSTYNFYNANYTNSLCSFYSNNNSNLIVKYKLFELLKTAHTGERTNFPIACEDGRKPRQNWSTNFLVFDESPAINNPLIGASSKIFASGWGNFTNNKIVEMSSGMEAGESQYYIAVCDFGFKKFLLKINK